MPLSFKIVMSSVSVMHFWLHINIECQSASLPPGISYNDCGGKAVQVEWKKEISFAGSGEGWRIPGTWSESEGLNLVRNGTEPLKQSGSWLSRIRSHHLVNKRRGAYKITLQWQCTVIFVIFCFPSATPPQCGSVCPDINLWIELIGILPTRNTSTMKSVTRDRMFRSNCKFFTGSICN